MDDVVEENRRLKEYLAQLQNDKKKSDVQREKEEAIREVQRLKRKDAYDESDSSDLEPNPKYE